MDHQVHLFLPHITVAVLHNFVGEKRQCHDAAHLLSMIAIDGEHHVLSIASEYIEDNVMWAGSNSTPCVWRTRLESSGLDTMAKFLKPSLRKNKVTMVIDEFDRLVSNQIYEATEIYLGGKISPNMHKLKVSKSEKEHNFTLTMESNKEISDVFNGVKFNWVCHLVESKNFHNPRDINSMLCAGPVSEDWNGERAWREDAGTARSGVEVGDNKGK
ncbi:hypothetical protein FH972_008161 [Carpinus fangiana]|uniref:AAA-type ATPase N-terminal domain-containing protein n=1 Tax=Carpinus fangiana TaxID=176857 RepID=A0A5N6QXU2_9ROSI|nr:hypothetical protein FH972_008161 [Carpinus fangiana]